MADSIDRTDEYSAFIRNLKAFHECKGTTLQAEPVVGRKKLDLLRLYQDVIAAGGFEQVTKNRIWKQIGSSYSFPPTCTNSAYMLKGIYIRNLLGWEEEHLWGKSWQPPQELLGPDAHKASTLAGKTYMAINKERLAQHTLLTPEQMSSQPGLAPLTISNSTKVCSISPLHHQQRPTDHVHSIDNRQVDCMRATEFDETIKQQLLNGGNANWVLNTLVTLSFECPEKLQLDTNPMLLNYLLDQSEQSQNGPDPMLKIVHILRNFSFMGVNAQIMASSERLKIWLVDCLSSAVPLCTTHCIDVLENIASYIYLDGTWDAYVGCLAALLYTSERLIILGSVRVLTLFASNELNQTYLLNGPAQQLLERVTQLLVTNDEELIGVALEYLYKFASTSDSFRQQLLTMHGGADLGILVSLLMFKSKYFAPHILNTNVSPTVTNELRVDDGPPQHTPTPCMPSLNSYERLEEPYRCLGWLKDRFEIAKPQNDHVMLLDDIYTLYELRFGHEKALKMKDFYTVLKIAFPGAASSLAADASTSLILDGTTLFGLQLKPGAMEEETRTMCHWVDCSAQFNNHVLLEQHVMHDHVDQADQLGCQWTDCGNPSFDDKAQIMSHLHTEHLQHMVVDDTEVQGVALVAAHLLQLLSQDPQSHVFFLPYELELAAIGFQRPKLATSIRAIFANFVSFQ